MKNDFLKINLTRFKTEKKLRCDVFLFLPVNNRMLKIIEAGNTFDESLLQKFKTKGIAVLYVSADPKEDPEKFELYIEELTSAAPHPQPQASVVNLAPPSPEPINEAPTIAPPIAAEKTPAANEPVLELSKSESKPEPESKPITETPEEEQVFSNDTPAPEPEHIIESDEPLEEKSFIISASTEEEDSPIFKLSNKIEAIKESMAVGKGSLNKDDQNKMLEEVEKSFTIEKISEEIIKISGKSENAPEEEKKRFKADIAKLEETIRIVSSSKKVPEEVKQTFSAKADVDNFEKIFQNKRPDPEEVIKFSERVAQMEEIRIKAMQNVKPPEELKSEPTKASMSARDTSSVVSILSISLAYNIGYVNFDFLSDIGAAAILYFAQLEGKNINKENISNFAKVIFDQPDVNNSAVEDARLILGIIEKYISSPDCDRAKKDFEKPLFEKACAAYFADNENSNPWHREKWIQSMDRLTTIDGRSLCTRSAAKAIKQSRELIA